MPSELLFIGCSLSFTTFRFSGSTLRQTEAKQTWLKKSWPDIYLANLVAGLVLLSGLLPLQHLLQIVSKQLLQFAVASTFVGVDRLIAHLPFLAQL